MPSGVVEDGFLDGRVRVLQPAAGYRAATDPVLLAAGVPAREGDRVLDLGCGVGVAALCLAARVPGLDLHGLEIQPDYAVMAGKNSELNRFGLSVHQGDLRAMPAGLKAMSFDHVMTNPPWFDAADPGSPDPGRDRANRIGMDLGTWISAGLARLKPGGWFVLIHRAGALAGVLEALSPGTGDITVLPLAARDGRDAKRVIVRARKGSRGALRLLAPLVLHQGSTHVSDGDDFTQAARAILRDGAAIEF